MSSAKDGLLAEFAAAKQTLRHTLGAETFASWLEPLALRRIDGDCAVLELPSRFMADWVKTHFGQSIAAALSARIAGIASVRIEAGSTSPPGGQPSLAADAESGARAGAIRNSASSDDPIGLPAFEPRYSFDQFITGKANELAFNAAQTLANAVGQGQSAGFNPLFLHGPTGLGKTHLMHAIGQSVLARLPQARVVYLSAERFMVEFLAALRERETIRFKQRLRSADLLMIDDVQFIAGKDSTQEEFFHTMNEIIGAGRWLVISADRSPQNLEGIESRIQSRLAWGLVADINPADYELRLNILKAKVAAIPGASVPEDVIEFLARRIIANVRELEGALNRVLAYANLTGRAVDVDFAREVLADLLRAHSKKLTIDDIQRRVAEHYRLKLHDLVSPRRAREVARPRQVAMYLAKQLTLRSLPEIGRRFGGRDHTTVMHAVKRIEELRAQDHELDRDIQHLRRILDS
ncbi:chromosomal replication initiator protein DnaA [Thermaurantiacus sp.]